MKNTFNNLELGIKKILPGLWGILKGFFFLIYESCIDLIKLFYKKWRASKSIIDYVSIILTSIFIGWFLVYGLIGLYKDIEHVVNKKSYAIALYSGYKSEIEDFFRTYNENFLARNCDFFRKVGADEAMYDKWGNEEYPENKYPNFCENFYQVQEKRLLPIKIGELEKNGNRYRVKGEMVVITKNQNESYFVQIMYYELWKELHRDLWHLNGNKDGPKNIETKVRN